MQIANCKSSIAGGGPPFFNLQFAFCILQFPFLC
jgi:hypothetical protein